MSYSDAQLIRALTRVRAASITTTVCSRNIRTEIEIGVGYIRVRAVDYSKDRLKPHERLRPTAEKTVTFDELVHQDDDPLEEALTDVWTTLRQEQWDFKRDQARRPVQTENEFRKTDSDSENDKPKAKPKNESRRTDSHSKKAKS